MQRIAIVHLGREQALGEQRRVQSWDSIISSMGATPIDVPLLQDHAAFMADWRSLASVATGRAVPERLAWSRRSLIHFLDGRGIDAAIFVTLRSFDREVAKRWPTILDYVDVLSRSYTDRASKTSPPRAVAWRSLGFAHRRVEQTEIHRPACAAGVEDARALGVRWIPNVITPAPLGRHQATHDVVFFGNLAYAPNRQSLLRLVEIARFLRRSRQDLTVLIGGANPDDWVRRLCREEKFDLQGPFDDAMSFARRGRVAVAPLDHAAGIQNKVLEAAAAGVEQVISPAAAAGLPPGAPVQIADDDESFALAIASSLETPKNAPQGPPWIAGNFAAAQWGPIVEDMLHE